MEFSVNKAKHERCCLKMSSELWERLLQSVVWKRFRSCGLRKDMLRNPSLRWSADKLTLDGIEVEEVNLSECDFHLR
jgi:hypothetical protein